MWQTESLSHDLICCFWRGSNFTAYGLFSKWKDGHWQNVPSGVSACIVTTLNTSVTQTWLPPHTSWHCWVEHQRQERACWKTFASWFGIQRADVKVCGEAASNCSPNASTSILIPAVIGDHVSCTQQALGLPQSRIRSQSAPCWLVAQKPQTALAEQLSSSKQESVAVTDSIMHTCPRISHRPSGHCYKYQCVTLRPVCFDKEAGFTWSVVTRSSCCSHEWLKTVALMRRRVSLNEAWSGNATNLRK